MLALQQYICKVSIFCCCRLMLCALVSRIFSVLCDTIKKLSRYIVLNPKIFFVSNVSSEETAEFTFFSFK